MISYAQNREDVVLARVFEGTSGFYVDVGAASPIVHSVTRWFYESGWEGINIDPAPRWHRELMAERPRDENLQIGLHDESGVLELLVGGDDISGQSTFSESVGASLRAVGNVLTPMEVPVRTLASVLDEYAPSEIDFLKIDVEGWERQVISGGDWKRHRPKIVVVEATTPNTTNPSHAEWAAALVDHGYLECLFDGLNRFYVRCENGELLDALSTPANAHDDYELGDVVALRDEVRRLVQEARKQSRERELLAQDLDALRTEYLAALHRADDSTIQLRVAREALETAIGMNDESMP